jgi:hypothetical protein
MDALILLICLIFNIFLFFISLKVEGGLFNLLGLFFNIFWAVNLALTIDTPFTVILIPLIFSFMNVVLIVKKVM